jgi:hypothetical protein
MFRAQQNAFDDVVGKLGLPQQIQASTLKKRANE